jgi:hypothetical protein
MDSNQYQQLALRTESPPLVDRYLRFLHCKNQLTRRLVAMREGLLEIDAIKKFIFYNRTNTKFNLTAMEEVASAEQVVEYTEADKKFLRLLHAVLGVMSECEEWIDPILGGMQVSACIDALNGVEEFGDFEWYTAIGADALGVTLDQVMRANVAKLAKRFPKKFTEAHAISRDLTKENQAMAEQIDK